MLSQVNWLLIAPPHMPSVGSASSSDSDEPPALLAQARVPDVSQSPSPLADIALGPPSEPVGVTILTGFLGSGKSTLVRRVLTEPHGKRVLVLENEFGDRVSSSIESAVITPAGGGALAELVSLPNGCVCCAASSDLTSSLARLLHSSRRFDHVLIEASGLADPGPVAADFWVDTELETMLRLDAIVTVVDSSAVAAALAGGVAPAEDGRRRLAEKQIAVADIVLLNKTDLAGGLLPNARSAVRALAASGVRVIDSVRCAVPLREILNLHAYEAGSRGPCGLGDAVVHVSGVGSISLVYEGVEFDATHLSGLSDFYCGRRNAG